MAYHGSVMFVDGEVYDLPAAGPSGPSEERGGGGGGGGGYNLIGATLCDTSTITGAMLREVIGSAAASASQGEREKGEREKGEREKKRPSSSVVRFLSSLLRSGFYYPID